MTDDATPASMTDRRNASAHIYAEGYRRFEGERLGERAAVLSLVRYTMQRVLGLRRSARHKVLPFLCVIIAYLPAIAFIGLLALLPKDAEGRSRAVEFLPSYAQYFGFVSAAIVLFAVFAAPEALCPDRRHRSLSLYLASPLTRDSYLLAKVVAVFLVMCLVTVGPLLLLLIGYVLQNNGPDGPLKVLEQTGRILAAGGAISAFYTAFALGLSSLTDRRGLATGGAILALLGTHIVAGALAFGFQLGDAGGLLSLLLTPFELGRRILGARRRGLILPGAGTATVSLVALAWTSLFSLLVWLRYTSLQVTR